MRVQLFAAVPGHVHPVPAIDTSVIPVGTISVTVTVPLVGPAPVAFDTFTLYVPFCPCVKLPVWALAMPSADEGVPWITVNVWPPTSMLLKRETPAALGA